MSVIHFLNFKTLVPAANLKCDLSRSAPLRAGLRRKDQSAVEPALSAVEGCGT